MDNIRNAVRKGLDIFGDNDTRYGQVESVEGEYFTVSGKRYPFSALQMRNGRYYLAQQGTQGAQMAQDQNQVKVELAEEQLKVGKREVSAGEVELQKRVVQEQVNIPVELRREEVNVRQVDTPDRPAREGEALFQEGTIRVPLMAEEAIVSKEAIVTGEVVLNKDVQTQRQTVSDSVRKEQVEVVNNQQRAATTPATTQKTEYTETARTGYAEQSNTATTDYASQIARDTEVYASDGAHLGKVKDIYEDSFELGRGFLAGSSTVPFSAISGMRDGGVYLNMTRDQLDTI